MKKVRAIKKLLSFLVIFLMVSQNVVYAYELAEKNTNNSFEDEINFENIDLDSLKDLDIEFPELEDYIDIESGNSDLDKGVIIDLLRKTRSLQDLEGTISYELEDESNKEVKVQDENNDSNYKIIDSQRRIYSSEEMVPFVFTSKVEDDIVNPYFIYAQDLKDGQSVEITISDETGEVYSTQMDSYTKEIDLSFIEKNKEYTVYVNSLYEDNVVAEVSNIGEIKGNAKITKRYICDYICEIEEDSNRVINDIWDIATDTSIKSEKVEQILNDLEEKNKENKNEEETVVDHVYGRVSKDIDNFEDESLEITYYLDEEEYSTRTSRRTSRRGYITRYEEEYNDDFDNANKILNDNSIRGTITKYDVDCYKVRFDKDGYANFWIGEIPRGEDYELEVFDDDDESDEIDWHYSEGVDPTGENRTLRAVKVREGRDYYIRVKGKDGSRDYDNNDKYKLRAKVYSSPDIEEDKYEDNNDFADATDDVFDNMRAGSKKSIEANIHSNTRKFDDEDYYELELKEKCGIKIELKGIQNGCDYDLALYDENEDRIARSVLSDNSNEALEGVLQAGKYYIRVDTGRGHSIYPYELSCRTYRFNQMLDQFEFNDDEDYAYELTANKAVKGTVFNREDRDYFKFELDRDSKVKIKLEDVPRRVDYQFTLLDEDVEDIEIVDEDGNGDNEELTIDLDEGIYYIMVEGDRDDDYDDDEQYKIAYYLDEQPQIPIESGIKLNIKYTDKDNDNQVATMYFINMDIDAKSKTINYTNNSILLLLNDDDIIAKFMNKSGNFINKVIDSKYVKWLISFVENNLKRNSRGDSNWNVYTLNSTAIEEAMQTAISKHQRKLFVDSLNMDSEFYEQYEDDISKGVVQACIDVNLWRLVVLGDLWEACFDNSYDDDSYAYYVGKIGAKILMLSLARKQEMYKTPLMKFLECDMYRMQCYIYAVEFTREEYLNELWTEIESEWPKKEEKRKSRNSIALGLSEVGGLVSIAFSAEIAAKTAIGIAIAKKFQRDCIYELGVGSHLTIKKDIKKVKEKKENNKKIGDVDYEISEKVWKDVKKKGIKGLREKIEKTAEKGLVGDKGEQGIKKLNKKDVNGKDYDYEIKIGGRVNNSKVGDIRIYGNKNSKGVIVFDKFWKH